MTAAINIFTADSKLRFPFPREVRSNRQGALFGSFLGYFFAVCFWTAQKVLFFCIFGVCLTIFSNFLTDFEVIWALIWTFFEKQRFLENRCFS